jgi:hypothetical protein
MGTEHAESSPVQQHDPEEPTEKVHAFTTAGPGEGKGLEGGRPRGPDNSHANYPYLGHTVPPRQPYHYQAPPMVPVQEHAPHLMPSNFDGKQPWKDWKAHFDVIAKLKRWDIPDRASYIAVSLRGQAQGVFGDLEPHQQNDYFELCAALERRFGSQDQSELHRVQLRSRVRQKSESLPELAQSVQRLVREAYPNANYNMRETLALENFLDALDDSDLRWKVAQSRPRSMSDAVRIAVELEAYKKAERQRDRGRYARGVQACDELPNVKGGKHLKEHVAKTPNEADVKTIVAEELQRAIPVFAEQIVKAQQLFGGQQERPAAEKRQIRCYTCGEMGHISRQCTSENHHYDGRQYQQQQYTSHALPTTRMVAEPSQ